MILPMTINGIKSGLGAKKTGAELTLADASQPQCLVPFSYYLGDVAAFEDANKCKLLDMNYKKVNVLVTSMEKANVGITIKLQGELQLAKQ